MADAVHLNYVFDSVRFGQSPKSGTGCAIVEGSVRIQKPRFRSRFAMSMHLLGNGEWGLLDMRWKSTPISVCGNQEFLQQIVNSAARLLYPINTWPGKQETGSATLVLNQKIAPPESADSVIVSFRPNVLALPGPDWSEMWQRIVDRVNHDVHFRVHGFTKEEILIAIDQLRNVFPDSWVLRRYKDISDNTAKTVRMGDAFHPEADPFWFPAYHLARVANGAICIDPGWSYFVELGLSVKELESFAQIDLLRGQLSRSAGTQYQVCLAAELYKRGLLVGLEQGTGSGSARNDLLVSIHNRDYDIETKAFTSGSPIERLEHEILDKADKMPNNPNRPLVFHVVLLENGIFDKKREDSFFKGIADIGDRLPDRISGVVGSRIFFDSGGGRMKRAVEVCTLNPIAKRISQLKDLEVLFESNHASVKYPTFGVGTFFYFETGPPDKPGT
ncbi:MAG: hypothetical protein WCJ37_03005 [Syntrophus sp. (in: bacteria)]